MDFCRARGRSGWWKGSGRWWRCGAGGWRVPACFPERGRVNRPRAAGLQGSGSHIREAQMWGTVYPHSAGACLQVPVQNLLAVPVQDTLALGDVIVDGLQVLDAEGVAADVGVDGDGHDL